MEGILTAMHGIATALDGILKAPALLAASTALDIAAVGVAWWLLGRARRRQAAAVANQREMLVRLRDDLSALVARAEERSAALEEALKTRETRLRALLAELGTVETAVRHGGPPRPDPAEARLLRDLERHARPPEGRSLTNPLRRVLSSALRRADVAPEAGLGNG